MIEQHDYGEAISELEDQFLSLSTTLHELKECRDTHRRIDGTLVRCVCTVRRVGVCGGVADVVGIRCSAISGKLKVSDQAARSIG